MIMPQFLRELLRLSLRVVIVVLYRGLAGQLDDDRLALKHRRLWGSERATACQRNIKSCILVGIGHACDVCAAVASFVCASRPHATL